MASSTDQPLTSNVDRVAASLDVKQPSEVFRLNNGSSMIKSDNRGIEKSFQSSDSKGTPAMKSFSHDNTQKSGETSEVKTIRMRSDEPDGSQMNSKAATDPANGADGSANTSSKKL